MFTTHNNWKSKAHDCFCAPNQQFWTGVELGLKKPWFVMTVCQTESSIGTKGIEFLRDFMVSNVSDIQMFAQMGVVGSQRLVSAMIVIPNSISGEGAWSMEPLVAIWKAEEPMAPGASVDICETQSGAKIVATFGVPSITNLTNLTLQCRLPLVQN
jgi:hypothetical protein